MRSVRYFLAAALVLGVSGTTMAQTSPPPPPPTPAPAIAPPTDGIIKSHWIAAGFVGSNWGRTDRNISFGDSRSVDYGGQLGYLYRGIVGGEFLADFTPSFGVDSVLLLDKPHVNSYMGNGIAALPLGAEGQFQPYVSGGWGRVQLGFAATETFLSDNQTTRGTNIGGGIMAFAGKVGFRGDARYYRASTINNLTGTIEDLETQGLLSGLKFWRTNVGVAFQW
jgi:hypothetical protein